MPPRSARFRTGRVTLLSRLKHDDYEKATFSFVHGVRDDPGRRLTNNSWDLEFGNGKDLLSVEVSSNQDDIILELGSMTFEELTRMDRLPSTDDGTIRSVLARKNTMYMIRSKYGRQQILSFLRVIKLVPGDRCTFDWLAMHPPIKEPGFSLPAASMNRLTDLVQQLQRTDMQTRRLRVGFIRNPKNIILQIRTGARGGHDSTLTLDGRVVGYPMGRSLKPLGFYGVKKWSRRSGVYYTGGYIPLNKCLVIESIDLYATAAGDSNGHGELELQIKGQRLFSKRDEQGPFLTYYRGRAVLRPGEEHMLRITAANTSSAELRISGRFLPSSQLRNVPLQPFRPVEPPGGGLRAGGGGGDKNARSDALLQPKVIIHVRAGAGGGNPNRVSMIGKASIYLDRMVNKPLSFDKPIAINERSVGYISGGHIPPDKKFVITRITYWGTAAGDSNGHGEFLIKVRGKTIVRAVDRKDPVKGVWRGKIFVSPGDEKTVFVEVANSSGGKVVLDGHFVKLKR